jgi:hypothetical protein
MFGNGSPTETLSIALIQTVPLRRYCKAVFGDERPSDCNFEIGTLNRAPHHFQRIDWRLGFPVRSPDVKVGRHMIVRVKAYRDPPNRYEPRHRLAARGEDIVHDVHFRKFETGTVFPLRAPS